MANYYATARSNYFAVKNEDAFRQWADLLGLTIMEPSHREKVADGIRRFAITPGDHADNGGWPDSLYDEEMDEVHDVNVQEQLAAHLADDEVAVLIQVGSEKLRYVDGSAVALNSRGENVSIDLWYIYELARTLGGNLTRAEY
jgi:hypothetical protein